MMSTPEPGFRPDDHPNWLDRLGKRRGYYTGLMLFGVVLIWGLCTLMYLAFPEDGWADAYGIAILLTIILPGFHWGVVRGEVIPADRWRFWVGLTATLVALPTLLYLPDTELGDWTGIYGFAIGAVLMANGMLDTSSWNSRERARQRAAARERVAEHSEWDRQHRRVTSDDRERP